MRVGALFAGYGGIELGLRTVLPDAELAWYAEIDKGACKVLTHRFPGVPNLGDVTAVDWARVEPVDVLTGGSPCQDLSTAGRRAGMTDGTRSNLWVAMRRAIAVLRPRLVIWENVHGALSATADSAVEPCPGCVGDGTGVALRALGRVVGDLAGLGYDTQWCGLLAADVGAPHRRFRVFLTAHPRGEHGYEWWLAGPHQAAGGRALGESARCGRVAVLPTPTSRDGKGRNQRRAASCLTGALLPTPRATDGTKGGPNQRGSKGDPMLPSAVLHLLPTPAVNDMGEGKTVEAWDEWTADMRAKHRNGNGHGRSLAVEAMRLMPTPTAANADSRKSPGYDNRGENWHAIIQEGRWGKYDAAITRWKTLTRPAPPPTETSAKGNPRLSPRFVEWLMGLPDGWVTGVPGITRAEALRCLGNGVVPQQCAAALRVLLSDEGVA